MELNFFWTYLALESSVLLITDFFTNSFLFDSSLLWRVLITLLL